MDVELAAHCPGRSDQGLAGHLPAVYPLTVLGGTDAPEDVDLELFEVQQRDEAVDRTLVDLAHCRCALALGALTGGAAAGRVTAHRITVHWAILPAGMPRQGSEGQPWVTSRVMKPTAAALREHARTDEGRKQLRYAGVSLVFVPLGQVLIQIFGAFVFNNGGDPNWTKASIVSAAILTIPNFFANKYLVWKHTSSDGLRTQVIVFWVAAMLGVSLATLLTYVVDAAIDSHGWFESVAVFFAQLVGFGIVWLARYFILDKWLFKVTHDGEAPDEDDLEMMHGDLPI